MTTRGGTRIVTDPNVRFGRPVIEGTRVDVATILQGLAEGCSIDEVAAEYEVTPGAVEAALRYAADLLRDYKPTSTAPAK